MTAGADVSATLAFLGMAGLSAPQTAAMLGVGLLAGVLGGLLGVGGGLVMIPAMFLLLGQHYGQNSFHLYKLASIAVSIVLSIPAALRHARAGAIVRGFVPPMAAGGLAGVVVGVAAAGLFTGPQTLLLRRAFGGFMLAVVAFHVYQTRLRGRAAAGADDPADKRDRRDLNTADLTTPGLTAPDLTTPDRRENGAGGERAADRRESCPTARRKMLLATVVGAPAGLIAGLLGLGGGVWAVPAQYMGLGVQLRNAIATSACTIVFIALGTSVAQSVAVAAMADLSVAEGLLLAAMLAPGALLGGWLGAGLTHRLSTRRLRLAVDVLLVLTGMKLLWG